MAILEFRSGEQYVRFDGILLNPKNYKKLCGTDKKIIAVNDNLIIVGGIVYRLYLDEEDQDHKILNDKLYKIIKHIDLDREDNARNINENGEIEIFTSFYNGGCFFDEALEYNLNKLKNEIKK